ncbi:MAG: riboflavin synthase [Flavobacteriales bacterium]|nr:riboflavin synthase [Flavobacteriales bacterium]
MFTGIIEGLGIVKKIEKEGDNVHFTFSSDFTNELKIDQSLAHNGACLTVVAINGNEYTVTAINETLQKTNLGYLKIGSKVNLERAMAANGRFDGHVVQGHVDQTAICKNIQDDNGSWVFTFEYEPKENITVEKGSITVNGVSLTVVNSKENQFSVCIIPYTLEHTTFHSIKIGDIINLEFDIVGKYVAKLMKTYQ